VVIRRFLGGEIVAGNTSAIAMKRLNTAGVLFSVAFAFRLWPHFTGGVHFLHWVAPFDVVGFWLILLLASVQLLRAFVGHPTFYTARIKRKP
jgi:hypothetical protein